MLSNGVLPVALPTSEAAGQPAWVRSNVATGHALCSVVRRDGSCSGNSTLTDLMFASPPPGPGPAFELTFTSRLAPSALLAFPTWNGDDTPTLSTLTRMRFSYTGCP